MKKLFLFLTLATLALSSVAQSKITKRADSWFDKGEYVQAASDYEALLKRGGRAPFDPGYVHGQLGEIYLRLRQYVVAETHFVEAIKHGAGNNSQIWASYGTALLASHKIEEARNAFQQSLEKSPHNTTALDGIRRIQFNIASQNHPQANDNPVTLETGVNADFNQFSLAWYKNTLLFSSDRPGSGTDGKKVLSHFFSAQPVRSADNNTVTNWNALQEFKAIEPEKRVSVHSFVYDPNTATYYAMRCKHTRKSKQCNIYAYHTEPDGRLSKPMQQSFHNKKADIGHPTLSSDGKVMIFPMTKDGRADLYMVKNISRNTWSEPIKLPSVINTDKDEVYPQLFRDSLLFFSSNGHLGMGGLDIFCTKITLNGIPHAISNSSDLRRLEFSSPINLEAPINSGADDIAVVIEPNGAGGFFISNRTVAEQGRSTVGTQNRSYIYSFPNEPYVLGGSMQGLLAGADARDNVLPDDKSAGIWRLPPQLREIETANSPILSYSYDPNSKTYYVTRRLEGTKNPAIYAYQADENGRLINSKPMQQSFHNEELNIAHPTLSSDGKVMFYTVTQDNRSDLYMVKKTGPNTWTTPIKLSSVINTDKDECYPQLYGDTLLIFSSNGHGGLGGLDVFYSRIMVNGQTHAVSGNSDLEKLEFSKPVNFGDPINTGADNILVLLNSSNTGGFTNSGFVVLTRPDTGTGTGTGTGTDKDKDHIYGFDRRFYAFEGLENYLDSSKQADLAGSGQIDFVLGTDTTRLEEVVPTGQAVLSTVRRDDEGNVDFIIAHAFFANNESLLREDAKRELQQVVMLMTARPNIRIEISGFTCVIGTVSHNQKLSEDRARAVYDYLVSRGISADRLQHLGQGSNNPIAPNATEEGRARNRRVEFRILEN